MPEYIERESLLKKAKELAQNFSSSCLATPHIIKAIENAPKADVVEVVRCKDCKRFLQMETSPSYDGKCCGYGYLVEVNHFCSYGERKEGAENENA